MYYTCITIGTKENYLIDQLGREYVMSKVQSRDNMIDTMSNVQQFQKYNIHQFDIKVECKAVKGHFQL